MYVAIVKLISLAKSLDEHTNLETSIVAIGDHTKISLCTSNCNAGYGAGNILRIQSYLF